MQDQAIERVKNNFSEAEGRLRVEMGKLRTGRAHPSMIEGLNAVAYGTSMPLQQLATITTPEPQLLQISPFDPSNLKAIADAIRNDQGLGLNPVDDGHVVRVQIPPLTTERRQQIVKQLHEKLEECHIALRQARHDGLRELKKLKDDKVIGEDELNRGEKQIDEMMNSVKASVESTAKQREQEIMSL